MLLIHHAKVLNWYQFKTNARRTAANLIFMEDTKMKKLIALAIVLMMVLSAGALAETGDELVLLDPFPTHRCGELDGGDVGPGSAGVFVNDA